MPQAFLCRVMCQKIELTLHHFHCQDLYATLFQGQAMQKEIDLQLYVKLQLNQWSNPRGMLSFLFHDKACKRAVYILLLSSPSARLSSHYCTVVSSLSICT